MMRAGRPTYPFDGEVKGVIACPYCGIRIFPNALSAHSQSKTCQRNRKAHSFREAGLVPCGTTWNTLKRVGLALDRTSEDPNDGRYYGPEWAVRLAAALAPTPVLELEAMQRSNARTAAMGTYDMLRARRRDLIARVAAADCADLRDAIVSTYALAGLRGVEKLIRGVAAERKWRWP